MRNLNKTLTTQWKCPTDRDPSNRYKQAVGRKQELSELWECLKHQQEVAVVGMPGLGKSTIASMFVQKYGDKYAGGQLWPKEIRNQKQCQAILNYWASWAYGGDLHHLQQNKLWQNLQFEPSAVEELLSDKGPILVVLDDIWDIEEIKPLRNALPENAHLLITTRDDRIANKLKGKLSLGVLTQEDSLVLLYSFLPEQSDSQLKQIAKGLGYHAQALTIAGGDIKQQTEREKAINKLLKRVETGEGFGDLPQFDQRDRQNEVEIAFKSSYDDIVNMGTEYQQRFRFLGIFGPLEADFSTAAAAAMWEDNIESATDFLDVLYGRSLLTKSSYEGENRWVQHTLLRAYSHELLRREDELEIAYNHYLEFVINITKDSFEHQSEKWVALKPDLPHIYYVGNELVRYASDLLGDFKHLAQPEPIPVPSANELDDLAQKQLLINFDFSFNMLPYLTYHPEIGEEGLQWLQMGLVLARVLDIEMSEAIFLNSLGKWYMNLGQFEVARHYFEQALKISPQNKFIEATSLNNLGLIYHKQGKYDQALKSFNNALPNTQKLENRSVEGLVLQNIGMAYLALGQERDALQYLNKALPIIQEFDNVYEEGVILQNIGMAYQTLGENDNALKFFNQALPIMQKICNRYGEGWVLQNMGAVYLAQGEYEQSFELLEQALLISQEVGNRECEGVALLNMGILSQKLGQNKKAFELIEQSLQTFRKINDHIREGHALIFIGLLHQIAGRTEQAVKIITQILEQSSQGEEQILSFVTQMSSTLENANILFIMASIFQVAGQPQRAVELINKSLQILRDKKNRLGEALTLFVMGNLHMNTGKFQPALKVFNQALNIFQEEGNRVGEGMILTNIGTMYMFSNSNQPEHATKILEQALIIHQEVKNHPFELNTLNNLGKIKQKYEPEQALEFYNQAIKIAKEVNSKGHEAAILLNIGTLLFQSFNDRITEGISYVEQAIEVFEINHLSQDAAGQTKEQLQEMLAMMMQQQIQPNTTKNISESVVKETALLLLQAIDWKSAQNIVKENQDMLLAPNGDQILTYVIGNIQHNNETAAQVLRVHIEVLGWCREIGIEAAFQRAKSEIEADYLYRQWGKNHLETENYVAALANFNRAIELQSEHEDNYYWRGKTHYNLEDYSFSIADFTRAIELQSKDVYKYRERGWAYFDNQDYVSALTDFSYTIELQPENAHPYLERGRIHYYLDKLLLALVDLNRAIELQPDNVTHYIWRSIAYHELGNYNAAIDDGLYVIKLQPENDLNHYWQALFYLGNKDYDIALKYMNRSYELAKEDDAITSAYTSFWRGVIYELTNCSDKAKTEWEKVTLAIQDISDTLQQKRVLALLATVQGSTNQAQEYCQQLFDEHPKLGSLSNQRCYLRQISHLFAFCHDICELKDWFETNLERNYQIQNIKADIPK